LWDSAGAWRIACFEFSGLQQESELLRLMLAVRNCGVAHLGQAGAELVMADGVVG